jgi:hypothetical protein
MALDSKHPDLHKLAHTLAHEASESITVAISIALEERLARIRPARKQRVKAAKLLRIGRLCAKHLKGTAVDHAALRL